MTTAVSTRGQMTGRKVLMMMLAFFGVIIAVNLTLAFFALNSDTGLVVKNSYVASQDFNRMRAAAMAQEQLGWKLAISTGNGEVVIKAAGPDGQALTGLTLKGMAGLPVSHFRDHALIFTEVAPGTYAAPSALGEGDWQVDVTATDAGKQTFRRIFRIEGGQG